MRVTFNEGQEVIKDDLNELQQAKEREFYDRVVYELLQRTTDGFFGGSCLVTYVDATHVSVAQGLGFQYDAAQVTPDAVRRPVYVSSNTSKTVTAAHATLGRIDIVSIKAARATAETESRRYKATTAAAPTSQSFTTKTDWEADIVVTAGTASGSPVAPSTPAGYIKIATLVVTAAVGLSGSSAVTDNRTKLTQNKYNFALETFTAALLPAAASAGRLAYESDTGKMKLDTGSIWENLNKDAQTEFANMTLAATVAANAMTIALKDKAGSNASASSPIFIGFRSSTLTSGVYNRRSVTAALSVVLSSGSTLGHSNSIDEYIYVYAMDNAGTVELAVSNTLYPDNSFITTVAEGGAGAADNATAIYSTTLRSNVPMRLIGRIKSNQSAAGTYASSPTEISLVPFPDVLNAPLQLSNIGLATSLGSSALTVSLKDRLGNTASSHSPIKIGFRSSSPTIGGIRTAEVVGALSVVVSSGSTLGHANAVEYPIYVYAIDARDFGGGVELAVSTRLFDDGSLATTTAEGGAGAADNGTLLYSTTARVSIPIRLLGRLKSTQATAGTWATAISEVSVGTGLRQLVYSDINNQNVITSLSQSDEAIVAQASTGLLKKCTIQNLVGASITTQSQMETGTDNTVVVSPLMQKYHPGHPKGWAKCTSNGVAAVGYNVSSVTDVGVGRVVVNWSTAFSSEHCVVATAQKNTSLSATSSFFAQQRDDTTTSACHIDIIDSNGTAFQDPSYTHVLALGDQP
jgi:hypothetical protein